MLGVGDGVLDNRLQERLQNTSGLLIDEGRDSLDTTSASQSSDGGLGDTLDVVSQDLSVSLGSSLSQTFSSLSASRHLLLITSDCTLPKFLSLTYTFEKLLLAGCSQSLKKRVFESEHERRNVNWFTYFERGLDGVENAGVLKGRNV